MEIKSFIQKYNSWYTDTTNDARGVFGNMDKRAGVPYLEFRDDLRSCKNLSILVEYYHPEKPYFWGNPKEFPYVSESGPGPERKPYIIKRSLDWYAVPEAAKRFAPLCFTVLQWEFEITVLVFKKKIPTIQRADRRQGIDLTRQFSRKEIDSFLEKLT